MIWIWLIIYLAEGVPNIFNNTGNDTAWLVTGAICALASLGRWIRTGPLW